MTQEDKDLILKDLGARLSYKAVAQVSYKDGDGRKTEDRKVLGVYTDEQVYVDSVYTNVENIKLYLRPMSSMTEEEKKEAKENGCIIYWDTSPEDKGLMVIASQKGFDWLNKKMFDYRGLIEKGLALEAPEGMYKSIDL